MKKIIYLLSAAALLFSSCDLKEESKIEVEIGKYVKNAEQAEQVLLGVYEPMTSEYLYGYHLSMLFPLGTDLAQVDGNGNISYPREIPTNTHNPSTKEIARTWNALYNAIYNANSFIETVESRMEGWSAGDRQKATYYIAEARALRGLYYFELVRLFGNIALVTETAESKKPKDYFEPAAPETVYAFIEEDLKYAAEILPWATEDHVRESNAFRISRGAALGLLTKVYCTWAGQPVGDESKWAEAVKTARTLVESGRHGLLPQYKTLWENAGASMWDPTESLIEVSFYWDSKSASEPVGYVGKWNGVLCTQTEKRGNNQARVRVLYPFALKWQTKAAGDTRYGYSIAEYRNGYVSKDWTAADGTLYSASKGNALISTDGQIGLVERLQLESDLKNQINGKETKPIDENAKNKELAQNCTPAKWDTDLYARNSPIYNLNYNSTINWYVLRYSDVLLLYAEAINESQGPTETAHAALNLVRRRAFGDTKHDYSGLSQTELRQAIRDERAYELCFEGHRKGDLIRWGIYYDTIRQTAQNMVDWYFDAVYIVANYTKQGRHELMPIPQTELENMPKFHQNDGWSK